MIRCLVFAAALALSACSPPRGQPPKTTPATSSPSPARAALTQAEADALFVDTVWRFGRADRSVIAARIVLRPGGIIEGYTHPNERSWAIVDGALAFRNDKGETITRFDRAGPAAEPTGSLFLGGTFKPNANVTHVLTRLPEPQSAASGDLYAYAAASCDAPLPGAGRVRLQARAGSLLASYRLADDAPDKSRQASVSQGGVFVLPAAELVDVKVDAGANAELLFEDGAIARLGEGAFAQPFTKAARETACAATRG